MYILITPRETDQNPITYYFTPCTPEPINLIKFYEVCYWGGGIA